MLAISLTVACSRYTYDGVILPAHPVRGESHNQRNTTGEVATVSTCITRQDNLFQKNLPSVPSFLGQESHFLRRFQGSSKCGVAHTPKQVAKSW